MTPRCSPTVRRAASSWAAARARSTAAARTASGSPARAVRLPRGRVAGAVPLSSTLVGGTERLLLIALDGRTPDRMTPTRPRGEDVAMAAPDPPATGADRLRTARASGRGARAIWRGARRWTHARGAGESGLARMSELGFVSTAGDTIIVTALAGTLFFSVSATAARDRVATSLLVTMVPFALLAPLIGPALDRIRGGRRYAMATTMLGRAFLAWVMADAVAGGSTSLGLYLEAFGFLLLQKTYLVSRSAAVPRVLPPATTLVRANSRISIAGVVALAIAAPIGGAVAHWWGASWALRLAFVVFATATVLAVALPERVDTSAGEERADLTGDATPTATTPAPPKRRSIGPRGVLALWANIATRWLSGFLTLFLAFRVRAEP